MIMLSVLILCILTIWASCESIQCQSYDDCLRKFKQFFKTQKEIYAISQDFVYSTRGDTQPGFAVFLEGKETPLSPSPDYTTDGIMEKFWYSIEHTPYLAKMDSLQDNALLANEILYYKIASALGIKTTPYF